MLFREIFHSLLIQHNVAHTTTHDNTQHNTIQHNTPSHISPHTHHDAISSSIFHHNTTRHTTQQTILHHTIAPHTKSHHTTQHNTPCQCASKFNVISHPTTRLYHLPIYHFIIKFRYTYFLVTFTVSLYGYMNGGL